MSRWETETSRLRETLDAAEAEIERIKDTNQQQYDEGYKHGLNARLGPSFEHVQELRAENDRLREALERIVERDAYREIVYPSRRYSEASYGPCAEIARAALAKETGE